ncbi:MAG: hypothetical protein M1480_12075 [Bacteroidetes bacterium]|nr:hypothetical protein [Bacteroidota bacterium]
MNYRKLLFILIGISSFIFYSCNDNPTSAGLNLLKNDYINVKQIDSYTDSIKQSSTDFKRSVPLGISSTLLVGNDDNVTSSSLIQFSIVLDDSVKQDLLAGKVNIISSNINLYPIYTFGDTNASMDFSVHKVLTSWDPNVIDGDNASSISYDQADLSSNRTFTDSLVTFAIDNTLVTGWLKYVADTTTQPAVYGIYLIPNSNSKKVVGFQALSIGSSYPSTLHVVLQKPGVYQDTLTFYPIQDASIVTGSLPNLSSDEFAVQGGLTVNSKLWFDISAVPKNTVINHALLTLTIDTLSSKIGTDLTNSLDVRLFKDTSNVAFDTTQIFTLARSGNIFQGDITPYVQSWIDSGTNLGILLQVTGQGSNLDLFAIKGSNAADRSLRPRLQLTYTSKN